MKSRKVLSLAMTAAMSIGAFAVPASATTVTPENVLAKPSKEVQHHYSSPIDLGIANDERLIEMLKKEGTIAKDATPAQAEKALNKFLAKRQKQRLKKMAVN